MRPGSTLLLAALAVLTPAAAQAGSAAYARPAQGLLGPETPITVGGRAPWNRAWEYDSGSDNDRRPELDYYQQGRGQQTGGPARNLLPDDGLHLFPR
ncbi:hypothetical protein [Methylobacterium planeticum]|uniref:Uncharacterized protein n=1 Tax=Methylobacterium planeticum TaxID=2615211 RepID=A0A6N6MV23_9HYPH|nr:hypothetical protein [Methylobacterium planeticum]KAB1074333.1 hypothetical protein F6X51_08130 [Methylobacterium planeticum]